MVDMNVSAVNLVDKRNKRGLDATCNVHESTDDARKFTVTTTTLHKWEKNMKGSLDI